MLGPPGRSAEGSAWHLASCHTQLQRPCCLTVAGSIGCGGNPGGISGAAESDGIVIGRHCAICAVAPAVVLSSSPSPVAVMLALLGHPLPLAGSMLGDSAQSDPVGGGAV